MKAQLKEGLDRIQEFIGHPGDVMNKAKLFDNDIKIKEQLSTPKIITILVDFGHKMEVILVKIRKLVAGPQLEPIWLPLPSSKDTPQKTRPVVELKTPLPQCLGKELVPEGKKKVTPTIVVPAKKMTVREPETPKMMSSEPSP